jgi:hypothetical protein
MSASSLSVSPRQACLPSVLSLANTYRLRPAVLPFKDATLFQEWLAGPYVRGSWHEYCRDFLARSPQAPEPDKAKVAQAAKDAINGRAARFLAYHPEKDGYTPEDHAVRFIVCVVADNMLNKLCKSHFLLVGSSSLAPSKC